MNKTLRYIVYSVLLVGLLAGVLLVHQSNKFKRSMLTCSELRVEFLDSLKFVSEEDIKSFLAKNYGIYTGQRLDSVRLARIEQLIESKSVILNSEAWTTDDGILHISISQRAPVMRFQGEKDGFYVDKNGYIFPLHKSFTADVPLVEGNISRDSLWIASMLELESFLQKHEKYSELTRRLLVDSEGDLQVVTHRGEEIFVLGAVEDLTEKYAMIEKYFAHIRPNAVNKKYKKVIVKYKNQIICREKDI